MTVVCPSIFVDRLIFCTVYMFPFHKLYSLIFGGHHLVGGGGGIHVLAFFIV
jgi:hypothetical protein